MLLEYFKAKGLLEKYGIESVESKYVKNWKEASDFAKGKPIALKVLSEKELHKSKAGLVKLGLEGDSGIRKAYSELETKAAKLKPCNIIAQKIAEKGIEIIIGGREDPQIGKLVLIGLGGIYVETFKDFALRVCPITRYDATEMLDQLKSKNVITYNGKSTEILVSLLLKASKLLSGNPSINELDLNPVIIRENGYSIVDIRVLE